MFKKILLAATLISAVTPALAANERWFEVELYIFERQGNAFEEMAENPANINQRQPIDMILPRYTQTNATAELSTCSEQDKIDNPDACTPQEDTSINYPSKISASIGASQPQHARIGQSTVLLANSQSQFAGIISALNKEGHKSLLHMTWQQSMKPRRQAIPVRLVAGKEFSKRYDEDGFTIDQQQTAASKYNYDMTYGQSPLKPIWQLDGAINIYLEHYLYVETALTLREEGRKKGNIDGSDATSVPYLYKIWMAQNKRVISNEIHYFDHPNMGMILQIRKMAQPAS